MVVVLWCQWFGVLVAVIVMVLLGLMVWYNVVVVVVTVLLLWCSFGCIVVVVWWCWRWYSSGRVTSPAGP